jgi:hypothetical protein
MRGVGRTLYHALRGGGAVIEGAEFLLTHRQIARRQILHLCAAASCTLIATWLRAWPAAYVPAPPAVTLPWYLVLVEWLWSSLPAVLTSELAAWAAQTMYVALALPRQLVSAVLSQRGSILPSPREAGPRGPALAWLGAGGLGCAAIAWLPLVGPLAAAVLACPVLGGGLVVTILMLRGWSWADTISLVQRQWALIVGLGLGLVVSLTIPVVNLVALPCAAVGTTCLLLREVRPAPVRTSAGRAPCASPDK